MGHKILVADDSVTIQKVVKITLGNDPVTIIECLDEASMKDSLNNNECDLVLLDFNLSQDKSGYELAKEVHELAPNCSIMALLGTFDTIDETKMKESFIEDKVVKPFESKEFISKVRSFLSNKATPVIEDEEDQWVVDAPQPEENAPLIDDDSDEYDIQPNELSKEISGWAMEVPGVIGEAQEETAELPPILDLASKEEVPTPKKEVEHEQPIPTIEESIENETSAEDFWTADEEVSLNVAPTQDEKIEFKLDEIKVDPAPISQNFETELKERITPIVEELVKKYCEQTIQKVAWEVIPDLAENLIRKELKEISQSIE
ncbi:MAG: response regulator [Bdellovibrionales bacterium]|nr:response regulator [Bdellovibrionales bacterium]